MIVKTPSAVNGKTAILALLLLPAVLAAWAVRLGPFDVAAAATCGSPTVVTTPNEGTGANTLFGVTALATDDVWAVGFYTVTTPSLALAEHWDGTSWQVITASLSIGTQATVLRDTGGAGANDLWVVGYYSNDSAIPSLALAEHWDGAQWAVYTPTVGTADSSLQGVTAVASNNVWAVGYYSNTISSTIQSLVMAWDGASWAVVASPNTGTSVNTLSAVDAVSANDIWAVGYYSHTALGAFQTLVQHWDGASWQSLASPNAISATNQLFGVTAVAANDVWAVGATIGATATQTLIEHWDGAAWTIVPSPNLGSTRNVLNAVAAVAANDVWAVGSYSNSLDRYSQTLVEHWDGTVWTVLASPILGTTRNVLNAVSAAGVDDVWAVGTNRPNLLNQTLAEHFSLPCLMYLPVVFR